MFSICIHRSSLKEEGASPKKKEGLHNPGDATWTKIFLYVLCSRINGEKGKATLTSHIDGNMNLVATVGILEVVNASYMTKLLKSLIKTDRSDDSPITFSDNYIMMLMGGVFVKQVDRRVQIVKDLYSFPLSCYVGLIGLAKELRSRSLRYD